jgi:hypothetical protein
VSRFVIVSGGTSSTGSSFGALTVISTSVVGRDDLAATLHTSAAAVNVSRQLEDWAVDGFTLDASMSASVLAALEAELMGDLAAAGHTGRHSRRGPQRVRARRHRRHRPRGRAGGRRRRAGHLRSGGPPASGHHHPERHPGVGW